MTRTSEDDDSHFLDHPEVLELFSQLFNNVLAESDRGAVLVGTSYVDLNLKKLFEAVAPRELSQKRLRAILDYPGPLSTFAAMIAGAQVMHIAKGALDGVGTRTISRQPELGTPLSRIAGIKTSEQLTEQGVGVTGCETTQQGTDRQVEGPAR